MKLEILRTYVILKANKHDVKPENMSIGSFDITLNNTRIMYDNDESYGGWNKDEEDPTIEWTCRGGSEVFYVDGEDIGESGYLFKFDKLPEITNISEVYYEAFNDCKDHEDWYEFDLKEFAILVIDRETNKEYEIHASQKVIDDYNVTCI